MEVDSYPMKYHRINTNGRMIVSRKPRSVRIKYHGLSSAV